MPKAKTPFGPRYGATLRKRYLEIWRGYKAPKTCPNCDREGGVHRIKIGLWACKKCGAKFTGAAYNIYSEIGRAIRMRAVRSIEGIKKANENIADNFEKTFEKD